MVSLDSSQIQITLWAALIVLGADKKTEGKERQEENGESSDKNAGKEKKRQTAESWKVYRAQDCFFLFMTSSLLPGMSWPVWGQWSVWGGW